jgi:peptidoglycan/xylan/chitin deacetylase (PgdA/CDA1 family)
MLRFSTINRAFIVAFAAAILIGLLWSIPWWIYIILGVLWITLTTIGSFHIRWNYHLSAIHSNRKTKKNWVAITFDDGPNPEFTPKVLKLLQLYNAKASFFCVGQQLWDHADVVKDIIGQGHTIGNHTYTHSNSFGFFGAKKVMAELLRTNAAIKKITGLETKFYRPAFGVTNPNINKAVKKLGLQTIGWSIRSLDTTKRSKKAILNRISGKLNQGDIILLHDNSEKTVEVLEQLLLFLQRNRMQSVTVDQLLEIEAYA